MLSLVVASFGVATALLWTWPTILAPIPGTVDSDSRPLDLLMGTTLVACSLVLRSPAVLVEGGLLFSIQARQRDLAARRRRSVESNHSTANFLDQIVVQLRSGSSLRSGFLAAAHDAELQGRHGLAATAARLEAGSGLLSALDDVDDRTPDVEIVATTLEVLERSGAPAGAALERAGDTVRERLAAEADALTQSQQAMASAAMLATLPGLFAAVAAIVEPDLLEFYLHQPAGLGCIVLATLLTWSAWIWIERLVWGPESRASSS